MLNLLEIRRCLSDLHEGIVASAELKCSQVIYFVQLLMTFLLFELFQRDH